MGAKEGQQQEEEEEETDNTRRARVREGKRAAQHGDFCSSFFFGDFTTQDTHTHTHEENQNSVRIPESFRTLFLLHLHQRTIKRLDQSLRRCFQALLHLLNASGRHFQRLLSKQVRG